MKIKIKIKENNMARRTISVELKNQVLEAAREQGPKNYKAIATQFGVSVPTIYNWLNATTTTETTEVSVPVTL
jgi:transposase-like protein